ncbi:MAG: hypothetical protein ABI460_01830 [Caldimonas sp.]
MSSLLSCRQIVPLLTTKFVDAAREYPIAFLRGADQEGLQIVLPPSPRNPRAKRSTAPVAAH